MALPGKYTVKFTAAGATLSAPLEIKMDPRVKTSLADLQRQFALASKLAASVGEFSTATQRAEDLRKQIAARSKEAEGNAELKTALDELEKKTSGVTGTAGGGGFGGFGLTAPDDKPKTLRQVSAALGGLLGVVESADAAPTSDTSKASAAWDEAGKATMARWSALQTTDASRVNALLEKAHLQPLKTN